MDKSETAASRLRLEVALWLACAPIESMLAVQVGETVSELVAVWICCGRSGSSAATAAADRGIDELVEDAVFES